MIYARMTYFYPPSLAVAALLWYFRGTQAQDASTATGSSNTSTGSPCEDQEIYSPLDNERMEHIATRVGRRNNTGASGHKNGDTTPSSSSSASTTSPTQFNYPPWPSTNLNRASSLGTTQSRSFHSTTSSTYQAAGADMYGWSSPIIFSIPVETDTPSIPPSMTASLSQSQCAPGTSGHPAVPSKPQYELTRGYRNRLWRRGFNNASRQLEQEWARRVEGKMRFEGPGGGTTAPRGFIPGSLEGVWEGGFLV